MTESNSPTALDWDTLHGFYTNIAEQLHKAGIKSLTTGGIACVRYGITQSTKDCDIIIPIASAAEVIEILARAEIHHQRCHLTLKYGAPLHRRWLEGGWISHTYFGQPEQPLARLDLFGKPPRMRSTTADENPYYLSRDGFARMKKTRREKDWAYANLLGLQMLEQREIAGILHITDAKKLREICQSSDIEWSLSNQRPLLKLAIEKDPRLDLLQV